MLILKSKVHQVGRVPHLQNVTTFFLILCGQHCIMRDHIQCNNLPVTALPPAMPSSFIARSLCPIVPWVCSSTSTPLHFKTCRLCYENPKPRPLSLLTHTGHAGTCFIALTCIHLYVELIQTCFVKERRRYLPINSKSSSYKIQGPH
jgi:hypothetical protein